MARSVLIYGESGSGKSTSIGKIEHLGLIGLDPNETLVLTTKDKPLPFPKSSKMYNDKNKNYASGLVRGKTIISYLKNAAERPKIKNVIFDDAQYQMAHQFMKRSGETGYTKFTEIGSSFYDIIDAGVTYLRKDQNFFVLAHTETTNEGTTKMKTIGKMLDNVITMEGLFTIVLYASTHADPDSGEQKYLFATNTTVSPVKKSLEIRAKSPVGLFNDLWIPNDLGFVKKCMDEYF